MFKSLKISAPKERVLYGVTIKKLPIAKYIKVLRTMEELPSILLGKAFPGQNLTDVFTYFKSISKDDVAVLLGRLMTVVPEELCSILSELLDIPKERLLGEGPDALSLTELTQIIKAFWDANDMTAFFVTARQLMAGIRTQTTGSSVGLQ